MADLLPACLSALATAAAAFAAWMSWLTARNSLTFQKRLALHQYVLLRLNATLTKLQTLKSLLSNVIAISDHDFARIEPLFAECQSDLKRLELSDNITAVGSSSFRTSSFGELIDSLNQDKTPIDIEINNMRKALDAFFT